MPTLTSADEAKIQRLADEIRRMLVLCRQTDKAWFGEINVRLTLKGGKIDFCGIEGAKKTMKL